MEQLDALFAYAFQYGLICGVAGIAIFFLSYFLFSIVVGFFFNINPKVFLWGVGVSGLLGFWMISYKYKIHFLFVLAGSFIAPLLIYPIGYQLLSSLFFVMLYIFLFIRPSFHLFSFRYGYFFPIFRFETEDRFDFSENMETMINFSTSDEKKTRRNYLFSPTFYYALFFLDVIILSVIIGYIIFLSGASKNFI